MDRALLRRAEWMDADHPAQFGWPDAKGWAARIGQAALHQALAAWFRGPLLGGDKQRLLRMVAQLRALHDRFDRPRSGDLSGALSLMSPAIQPLRTVRASAFRSLDAEADGAVVYVHGGSFVAERSPRITALIARIAAAARLPVVAIDYRLAPEHACPAAVDDVEQGIAELIEGGIPPSRIAVAAESAGASIALAAMVRLAGKGVRPSGAVFLSPWVDLTLGGKNGAVFRHSGWGWDATAICAHLYLQGREPADPVGSPVFADLRGLPPVQIHTSDSDPFSNDAGLLADKLNAVRGTVSLKVWRSGGHVFERFFDGQSNRSIAEAASFLRARIGQGRSASE
jgi:epsilon-lactone hydrolase